MPSHWQLATLSMWKTRTLGLGNRKDTQDPKESKFSSLVYRVHTDHVMTQKQPIETVCSRTLTLLTDEPEWLSQPSGGILKPTRTASVIMEWASVQNTNVNSNQPRHIPYSSIQVVVRFEKTDEKDQ